MKYLKLREEDASFHWHLVMKAKPHTASGDALRYKWFKDSLATLRKTESRTR